MTRKGFTLIEMLVVVLIIGLLASVALPQYFKSVEKTRSAEGIEFIRAVISAQNRYWMKTGSYANDINKLDIGFPLNRDGCVIKNSTLVPIGCTTYFGIGIANAGRIMLTRKDSVPIYGNYKIEAYWDSSSSPIRITIARCYITTPANKCDFLDGVTFK